MNVIFEKEDLLTKLTENRRQHARAYEISRDIYKVQATEELKKAVEKVEAGGTFDRYDFKTTSPRNHTDEYDHAIAMVSASPGETVELDSEDFSHYILDNWEWMRDFKVHLANGALAVGFAIDADLSNYT